MWPDRRILELFGIEHPIVQAPMAGANDAELAIAVSEAGGLGSLPCAMLTLDGVRTGIETIRARTNRAFNVNFFCHAVPRPDAQAADRWRQRLSAYYEELGVDPAAATICAPVQRRRRRSAIFSARQAGVHVGEQCGREEWSCRPARPSAWKRSTHLRTVLTQTPMAVATAPGVAPL